MATVIFPPTYCALNGPLIFLAGPIQGAPDWHREAIDLLQEVECLHIACPRRETPDGKFSDAVYDDQVAWEHHHLEQAGKNGVILFWLAREFEHRCERCYAQTTRFELGEAVTLHRWQGIKMVVGVDPGFSNARYLQRTIARKAPKIPICGTLAETCDAARKLLADSGLFSSR